jgi:hypothetical protein
VNVVEESPSVFHRSVISKHEFKNENPLTTLRKHVEQQLYPRTSASTLLKMFADNNDQKIQTALNSLLRDCELIIANAHNESVALYPTALRSADCQEQ